MFVFEGPHRKIALWLDGERLDHAIVDAADGPTVISGEGPLADAVLVNGDERHELPLATAVTLGGRVVHGQADLRATLLVDGKLLTGELERARGKGCQVVLHCFDTLRDTDDQEPAPVAAPAASSAASEGLGWADVAAASAEAAKQTAIEEAERAAIEAAKKRAKKEAAAAAAGRATGFVRKKVKRITDQKSKVALPKAAPLPKASSRRDDFVDEPIPEEGDYVEHRQFGVCLVERIDDEGGMTLKLANGRRRRVILDIFHVLEPRIEDEKIIYPLRPRRR